MKKDNRSVLFRTRLRETLALNGVSQAELAERTGVDRSTISALLTSEQPRLPNGHLVAGIAQSLSVTADWLLGLSNTHQSISEILSQSLEVKAVSRGPSDEQIQMWSAEVAGAKIRNVPATLPEFAKTNAVLKIEYSEFLDKTWEMSHQEDGEPTEVSRLPESDLEYCMSMQLLEALASRQGIWSGLTAKQAAAQLDLFIGLHDELYPRVRIYLYDGLQHYSAPITVFGAKRSIVFLGQSYFVFNTREHIHAMTQQFDLLIKDAVVQAHEFPDWIGKLRKQII